MDNLDEETKLRVKSEKNKLEEFLQNLEQELLYGGNLAKISVDNLFTHTP
jgi:hypothetical protein